MINKIWLLCKFTCY